mmetsp:Transcript_22923/g.22229  ORF Transcript_22923/g.22229 Transcript_22923/m.22229 type:complete len:108 (+) Transcript_22923:73-396(+)
MNDPRINFVCLDFPEPIERIDSFIGEEDLNEKLDSFVSDIINEKVSIDMMQGEMVLPKLFQSYREDFGSTDEGVLKFVFKYYKGTDVDEEQVIREVCQRKSMLIRYE